MGQRMGTAPCGQASPERPAAKGSRSSLRASVPGAPCVTTAAPGGAQLQRGLGTLGAGVPASSRRSPG